ncbi:carbamoyltransferase C-terminal domain-containing protein [Halobacteriaceae archaeon SHR40]|uniref:carbamoyltransferase family protein n=1 Tax=Halovenus amylolytica TaxID=2500550 RepID=UPI000FE30DB0
MVQRILGINPTTEGTGSHDPAAVIIEDSQIVFGAEEERFNRRKHSRETFPKQAVEACLDFCDVELSELDTVAISWEPKSKAKYDARLALSHSELPKKGYRFLHNLRNYKVASNKIQQNLSEIGSPVPPVETYNHHYCHAASAFSLSSFDEALVVSVDGRGEKDATVVWKGDQDGLERVKTYEFPNSLGGFFGTITAYLGYRLNNGEGKIMGLAPYGEYNEEIADKLLDLVKPGVEYDVSALNYHTGESIPKLEAAFGRPKKSRGGDFSDWEKDLAHIAQWFIEKTVADIVETYSRELGIGNVALAGGVALNCKMNKRVMELDAVDDIFIQPVAQDAGSAVGAGILEAGVNSFDAMSTVYWGPSYSTTAIEEKLDEYKINYTEPDQLAKEVAKRLADGELVGWFQGRLEMGPRALGNRSILADPRTRDSLDRVNRFVKHREEWRPFAPSLLESAADEYLINAMPAPYMIKTFDVYDDKKDQISAVLHPADDTTRPQTVSKEQNPRYHKLLSEFENITGVPVLLNTSFNDSGEPIVNTPTEAIKDFYGMGLDTLVLGDVIVEKSVEGKQPGLVKSATKDK